MRREKAPKPVTRIDDEFLVILALRMAAYHTLRDDLKPQYLRIAEEREAQRMQALAGQGMTAQQVEAADRLTQASYSNEQVSQVCWQELVDLHTLADMVLAKYQVRTSPSAK